MLILNVWFYNNFIKNYPKTLGHTAENEDNSQKFSCKKNLPEAYHISLYKWGRQCYEEQTGNK